MTVNRFELEDLRDELHEASAQDQANADAYVGLIIAPCIFCFQGKGCTYCGHNGYVLRGSYNQGEGK